MPFLESSQKLLPKLLNDITLDKVLDDIQKAQDIELVENALESGRRPLPEGRKSPFMIVGPFPSEYDLDKFYDDPELSESVDNICKAYNLNRSDLYLTYGVKYPKDSNSEHPMFKDGKRHMKRWFYKEILIVQPQLIFVVGKYTKDLFEKTFRINLDNGLQEYTLPLRIDGVMLDYSVKLYPVEDLKDAEQFKKISNEVETIKIDWKYIHLHVHNTLSFKDGIGTPQTRIDWHRDNQKPAIATSNHGNICDWITIYNGAKENGMKPILGMEAYINWSAKELRESLKDDSPASKQKRKMLSRETFHGGIYAKNYTGFKNLIKIHNDAWVDGFYRFPICDPDVIADNSQGLIMLSGCGSASQNRLLAKKMYLQSDRRKRDIDLLVEEKVKAMTSFFRTKNDEKFSENEYLDQSDFEYFYANNESKFNEQEYREFALKSLLDSDKEQIENTDQQVRDIIDRWYGIFGEDYYIELMLIDWEPQVYINHELIKIAQEKNISIVITNDAHYLSKADSELQVVQMLSDQDATFADIDNPDKNVWTIKGKEFYYKTVDELYKAWRDGIKTTDFQGNELVINHKSDVFTEDIFWKGIKNVTKLVDSVEEYNLDKNEKLPKLYEDGVSVLVKKVTEGLKAKGLNNKPEYRERVKFELKVITQKGYVDYFLIMEDIISWAKKNFGPDSVGPARGSAAGSLVNYLIGITNVDPLRHDLLFERFLDLERTDLPDIDTDFEPRIRDKVINYMIKRFGREQVANIGTFGLLKIKSAIQDVARVCGIPPSEVFSVTKVIPQDVNDTATLDELEDSVPKLKKFLDKYDSPEMPIRFYINGVRGAHRQPGSHAAGVLVSSENLKESVALIQSKKNIVTGWLEGASGHELSDLGYAKFDILGLNNLQVVNDSLKLIEQRHGKKITTEEIDANLDDPFIYENIVKAGDHYGIFQMESGVASKVCKQVDPDNFDELCAISALIRPGTLSKGIPEMYSARKKGQTDENGDVWRNENIPASIRDILSTTYGLMVYQEQLMKIAEYAANFTKAETNNLRRQIVKFGKLGLDDPKFVKNIKAMYDKFIDQASRPLDDGGLGGKIEAQEMWDLMVAFAGYSFNLSHSISYTYTTFREYWLKAYYRPEFNVALLNNTDKGSKKKGESLISIYATEIMGHGMKIQGPSVNKSNVKFELLGDETIIWGLNGIKAIPDNTIIAILRERKKNGEFDTIDSFYERVTEKGKKKNNLNKRALDALVWSGALDEFIDDGGFEDRFDLRDYIFKELRKDKSYKPDKPSYKKLIENEVEYINLSLTEMLSFGEMRKELQDAVGKEVNYLYETEDEGSYYIIAKVDHVERKKTKTNKDYVRVTLKDETKRVPYVYVWPWKDREWYALKKGQIIAGNMTNDGNFTNLVAHQVLNNEDEEDAA